MTLDEFNSSLPDENLLKNPVPANPSWGSEILIRDIGSIRSPKTHTIHVNLIARQKTAERFAHALTARQ
jgi:hypothetical protein